MDSRAGGFADARPLDSPQFPPFLDTHSSGCARASHGSICSLSSPVARSTSSRRRSTRVPPSTSVAPPLANARVLLPRAPIVAAAANADDDIIRASSLPSTRAPSPPARASVATAAARKNPSPTSRGAFAALPRPITARATTRARILVARVVVDAAPARDVVARIDDARRTVARANFMKFFR
jgi:hypothetical protein